MTYNVYQIDAFTDQTFSGNPAAVVPLDTWLPDEVLQNIAMENNLSETAFFVPEERQYYIRWFTPDVEVNLCGHATLASSHVLFKHLGYAEKEIWFRSRSGNLTVQLKNEQYVLNFPADKPVKQSYSEMFSSCFDRVPDAVLKGSADYLFVFNDEQFIRDVRPNLDAIRRLNAEGVIITSRGSSNVDFVSRFFAPQLGIPEDPVTGSAHTVLIPYWSENLKKDEFLAHQVSKRGGVLKCKYLEDRCEIGGNAVTFLEGTIRL
ncbi:PhzF family phenazine biosynthesis protein [Marinilabilia salmonicolor]|uniref:PhzF family phenazine biosynthesis protein n=1 Tax=Marinilabilia salmonicolor TaxID=989 RepID=A0A368VB97_9BACT|nr:PhzF family phenazine biosynthesis protein [Marinilabilia salmonicolor]RCW38386.1 PhzF family phenazine biosynthesis protein [Marinilabilia salmonicolor]